MTPVFKKAVRSEAKLRLAIDGPAGAGKTFTALTFAKHLGGKVAVIDSERGSASLYADITDFDVLELTDFSPLKYIEAIKAAADNGYGVLIIDSLTHAWAGTGGALDMVSDATKRSSSGNSYYAWREVTPLHMKLVDSILSYPGHVICTMRTKMEHVVEEVNGKKVVRKIGMQSIQREGTEYEFTIVGDMNYDHDFMVTKSRCSLVDKKTFSLPGKDFIDVVKGWLESAEAQPAPTFAPPAASESSPSTQSSKKMASKSSQAIKIESNPENEKAMDLYTKYIGFDAELQAGIGMPHDQFLTTAKQMILGKISRLVEEKKLDKEAHIKFMQSTVKKYGADKFLQSSFENCVMIFSEFIQHNNLQEEFI